MRLSVPIIGSPLLCRGDHRALTLICGQPRLIYASLLVASTCFLLAILTGCRQPTEPVLYKDLCGLTSEQMGVMGDVEVRQWLEEEYGGARSVLLDAMLDERYKDSVVSYGWGEEGRTFVIASLRDGRLFRISWHDVENGPTFGQVVAGLGPPEMVDRSAGMYEPLLYTIVLDYPALGVSVGASNIEKRSKLTHQGELVAPLTEDMQIDHVDCYAPGSMEEVLREVFFLSPENVSYHMQRRMPWPGFGALIPLDY